MPLEQALVNGGTVNGRAFAAGTIPGYPDSSDHPGQDLCGRPAPWRYTSMTTDPTWAWGSIPARLLTASTPVTGDLWWPHVYMPAQNPFIHQRGEAISAVGTTAPGSSLRPRSAEPVGVKAVKPFCIDFGPVANEYCCIAGPAARKAGNTQPILGGRGVPGHHAGQRYRLSRNSQVPARTCPLPDPQRIP